MLPVKKLLVRVSKGMLQQKSCGKVEQWDTPSKKVVGIVSNGILPVKTRSWVSKGLLQKKLLVRVSKGMLQAKNLWLG